MELTCGSGAKHSNTYLVQNGVSVFAKNVNTLFKHFHANSVESKLLM